MKQAATDDGGHRSLVFRCELILCIMCGRKHEGCTEYLEIHIRAVPDVLDSSSNQNLSSESQLFVLYVILYRRITVELSWYAMTGLQSTRW